MKATESGATPEVGVAPKVAIGAGSVTSTRSGATTVSEPWAPETVKDTV